MLPIAAALIKAGLPLLGNAILSKGQELVEEKLGTKLPELSLIQSQSPEAMEALRKLEIEHEEFLLTDARENRKIDLEEYKTEISDRQDARNREVEIEKVSQRPWWMPSFIDFLTLVVVVGGAWLLLEANFSTDLRMVIVSQIASVLAYYYGTTRRSNTKDETIRTLASKEK